MSIESCVCLYLFVFVCVNVCCPLVYYSEKFFTTSLHLLLLSVGIAWYVLSRVDTPFNCCMKSSRLQLLIRRIVCCHLGERLLRRKSMNESRL